MAKLAHELLVPDRDLWFRTTLYVVEGHWGEGTRADLVITGFTQTMAEPEPMTLGVSTWRRSADVALPPRVKCSANYVTARLARIEVRRLGYDDAILLNLAGRVAETTGACLLMAVDGTLFSPPTSEGALESITLSIIEDVCAQEGIPFVRRPIDRSELLVADEVYMVGTITELYPVSEIDGYKFRTDGVLKQVRTQFLAVMRGARKSQKAEMVPLFP
jgi:branched-chain amino acid aminotransferase